MSNENSVHLLFLIIKRVNLLKMRIFIIINALLFACLSSVFAQYPTVNNTRPRIWVDSARFSFLQEQIGQAGEAQDTYNEVRYAYENYWINDPQLYLEGSDSTLWTWDWSSPYAANEALLTVFFFKMGNDPLALKRCRFIAGEIIGLIDTIDFSPMGWYEKENLLRQLSDHDILLDQCYDSLPYELRSDLVQSLYMMNREFMNTYILSSSGESYVSSHNTWNNIFCNQNALTLYNAEGLTEAQKDTVNQWYETIYDKHSNGFIPCWSYYRDDDGGWNWGAAYAMWSLVDQFQLFENMRIGTDKNYYEDLPWVQNSINQYVYFIQPDNNCIHLGDGQMAISADRTIYLHASIYNDPRSLWMAQYWSADQFMTWTIPRFQKLLFKDFTMPQVSQPDLPLNWWADKVGLSVSRSSWDEDAVMLTFFNSPSKRAAHEHRDNNSFAIFKDKPLLLDAGYYDAYGTSHYKNYYERTIAHNTICVYDSMETYYGFGEEVSNDGGQIESPKLWNYDDIFLPEHQRGEWIKYASGPNYEYNIADAQLSYDEDKLDLFRRRLLYIKPNKMIVVDHVHLKNTGSHQRDIFWIAHFANRPIINGSVTETSIPNHIVSYNGDSYTSVNGNGSIAIKTLLPESTIATLIGGEGYKYWVDGVNYAPDPLPDTNRYRSTGNWRIEVRPEVISDTITYLHTIFIGDSVNIAEPGGRLLQNETSIGCDWNDTLYFFAANGGVSPDYHILTDVAGGRDLKIFIADLSHGFYHLKVDGNIVLTISTDENGILQASIVLNGGTHIIEIVSSSVSVQDFQNFDSFYISPNPATSQIHLNIPNFDSAEIEIYDATGKLMMQKFNTNLIDISSLTKGQYYILVKQKDTHYTAKFIKE